LAKEDRFIFNFEDDFWNYQGRGACSMMRLIGSAFVALIALYLVDQEFYDGRYSSVVVAVIKGIGRSIGLA
jgi:hypothetical protein